MTRPHVRKPRAAKPVDAAPFSTGLTDAETERLALLIEEAGEVIQAATKVLRHGYESTDPTILGGRTNRVHLADELGHLFLAAAIVVEKGDLLDDLVWASADRKADTLQNWLHFNGPDVVNLSKVRR